MKVNDRVKIVKWDGSFDILWTEFITMIFTITNIYDDNVTIADKNGMEFYCQLDEIELYKEETK